MSYSSTLSMAQFNFKMLGGAECYSIAQVKSNECVPCSIGIVLRQIKHPIGKLATIDKLRQASQKYPYGYRPDESDIVRPPPIAKAAVPKMGSLIGELKQKMQDKGISAQHSYVGTYMDNAFEVLTKEYPVKDKTWKMQDAATPHDLKKWFRNLRPWAPGLCCVDWQGGGAHAIVCLGCDDQKSKTSTASDDYYKSKAERRLYWFSDPGTGKIEQVFIPTDAGDVWYKPSGSSAWGKFRTTLIWLE